MTTEVPLAQYTFGGSRTMFDGFAETTDRTLGRILERLGGPGRTTLIVERIPDGAHFDDMPERNEPFLQAAGSAEALTIEFGRQREDGSWNVAALGRGNHSTGAPDVPITFNDDGVSVVYEDEVFEAQEAADVFRHFVRTGTPPDRYHLRELNLAREDS